MCGGAEGAGRQRNQHVSPPAAGVHEWGNLASLLRPPTHQQPGTSGHTGYTIQVRVCISCLRALLSNASMDKLTHHLVGLDAGEVQDVGDERQQRLAGAADRVDQVPLQCRVGVMEGQLQLDAWCWMAEAVACC